MRNIDDYTEQYQVDYFELQYKVPYRRKHVLKTVKSFPHACVLEIGCGMEPMLAAMTDLEKGIIVEPSEAFAARAKTVQGVSVIQSRLEDCVNFLQKEEFDFVILSALLHEVENPVRFLRAVHSLCNRNTVVHVNVPNANSFHRLLGVKCSICDNIHTLTEENLRMQQHTVFDAKSLDHVIHEAAAADGKEVQICSSGSFFVKPFTNKQMGQCIEKGIITPKILEGLDRMIEFMPDFGSELYVNYRLRDEKAEEKK